MRFGDRDCGFGLWNDEMIDRYDVKFDSQS